LTWQLGPGHSQSGRSVAWPADEAACAFTVSDRAVWLVLEANAAELRRMPVLLRSGEVNLVRD
jgi:hypothetical protein